MSRDYPWGKGTIRHRVLTSTHDSDVTTTVPAGKVWLVEGVYCEILTTATVGNRLLSVVLNDGTDNIFNSQRTGSIAASSRGAIRCHSAWSAVPTASTIAINLAGSAAITVSMSQNLPQTLLAAGSTIRTWDAGAIDAAADDMVIVIDYVEYDA